MGTGGDSDGSDLAKSPCKSFITNIYRKFKGRFGG